MSSVFTQSENRAFEESRCRARNMAGATPPPPEPEGPWCKTIVSGMTSHGYKPYKSWEQHSDSDDDTSVVDWVFYKFSWLANGAGAAINAPVMEPYSSSLYLRATWESSVTFPGGTVTLQHNIVINRYTGAFDTDQWRWRTGEGFWQDWDPDGGQTPYDWLYINMTDHEGLQFIYHRTRSVTVGAFSASGTETTYWSPSTAYPDGTTTTWTASWTMFNPLEDWWSESLVSQTALNMLNSVSFASMAANTMTGMSVSAIGGWTRTDSYMLPFSVGATFPAGGFNIVAEGYGTFGFVGSTTWGSWNYRKSRVAWPEAEEDILNSYALSTEQRTLAYPATSVYPGPDNSVEAYYDAPTYMVFNASAGMKQTYYNGNGRVHIGSAWAIPSESSAAPPSSSQGPLSTQ